MLALQFVLEKTGGEFRMMITLTWIGTLVRPAPSDAMMLNWGDIHQVQFEYVLRTINIEIQI